jgi:hypothetical protein
MTEIMVSGKFNGLLVSEREVSSGRNGARIADPQHA